MILDITALYQLYRNELVNYLFRMVNCYETAQDLVQESYLVLARTASVEVINQPRGFLYRTASNLAFDHLRHNKVVMRHTEVIAANDEPEQVSIESELSKTQWRTLLGVAIAELPPRCRDAFILHKLHGLSYREVAQRLDISESAVEKHITKGLKHCRKRLGGHLLPTLKN
ncbi:MAG: RNA polymerase sigma factor [Methylovulum sp.]|nr:RNA polymerase sigma factor [Methylovulum sp.]